MPTNLPTRRRYEAVRSRGVSFPFDNTNLKMWYRYDTQGSDYTVDTTGGRDSVPLWVDNSGNGYDFSQGTKANQPTAHADGLHFNNSDYVMAIASGIRAGLFNGEGAVSVFMTAKIPNFTGEGAMFQISTNGAINSPRYAFSKSSGHLELSRIFRDDATGKITGTTTPTMPNDVWTVYEASIDYVADTSDYYRDGSLIRNNVNIYNDGGGTFPASDPAQIVLGKYSTLAAEFIVNEMIVLGGAGGPTQAQRDSIEAYLTPRKPS